MGILLEEPVAGAPDGVAADGPERNSLTLVSCIIRPERLDAVKEALDALGVVGGMTITDVRGFGRQKGQVEHYRGGEYTIRFIPKIRVDMAIRIEDVKQVIAAVSTTARTGHIGDGKVFVVEMESALRVRTGERGPSVL